MENAKETLGGKVARLEKSLETLELAFLRAHASPETRHRHDEAVRKLIKKHDVRGEGGKMI